MRGVSCTQLQPMSSKYTIHHPTTSTVKSMAMVMPIHTKRTAIRIIKPRLLPSPIAQRHRRQPRNRSSSSVSPQSPYRTTNYRLATPRAVSVILLSFCHIYCKRVDLSPHRLDAFVHPSQGVGRWIIWYCLVVRLAWDATAQYTFIPHAMWSRC